MENVTLSKTGERAILMEPKDLRIGNILLYDGRYVHVTHISLDIDDEYQDTIGFCYIGKTTGEICDWNRALCDKLNPVPLTPEILDRCGFKFERNDGGLEAEIDGLCFRLYGDSLVFLVAWIYTDHTEIGNPIEYLHQLQNLYFALTGKELTLNLSLAISDNPQSQKT